MYNADTEISLTPAKFKNLNVQSFWITKPNKVIKYYRSLSKDLIHILYTYMSKPMHNTET